MKNALRYCNERKKIRLENHFIILAKTLFPFFDGLIPEGWLLDIVTHNWKISPSDRFGVLLVACKDAVGNVSVRGEKL